MEEEITRRVSALVQSSGLTEAQARMIIEKVIQHFQLNPLRLRDVLGTLPASALPPGTVYPTGTPAAGSVPTYDAVTGTTVWTAPAGGGAVATDAIWDAAGDLAVGSGANTAVRLAKGTALQVLRVNSGATALEWAAASGGPSELGYVQITANVTTTSTSYVDVPGLSVTVTIGSRPLIVEAWCLGMWHSGANNLSRLRLYDATAAAEIAYGDSRSIATANSSSPRHVIARVTPAAGTRTYKAQIQSVDAGTTTLGATATSPAFLRVTEV